MCFKVAAWFHHGGVIEFVMAGSMSSSEGSCSKYGVMTFGCFLALYGSTSLFQKKLFKGHVASEYNLAFYIATGSYVFPLSPLTAFASLSVQLLPIQRRTLFLRRYRIASCSVQLLPIERRTLFLHR